MKFVFIMRSAGLTSPRDSAHKMESSSPDIERLELIDLPTSNDSSFTWLLLAAGLALLNALPN